MINLDDGEGVVVMGKQGLGASSRKLTRSAKAERDRISAIYRQAVTETMQTILTSGWSGFTATEKRKQRAIAEAFKLATACLRRALDETPPPHPGDHNV